MAELYAYSRLRQQRDAGAAAVRAAGRPRGCSARAAAAHAPLARLSASPLAPPAPLPHAAPPRLLPAWEAAAGGGRGRQLAWDGASVHLVDPQAFAAGASSPPRHSGAASRAHAALVGALSPGALARALERQRRQTVAAFFPDAASVTPDYWPYARFRFLQRVAAQCLTVLATQNMLLAVGLGATRALPAAAALNWVLKDGLGRVGKLAVATKFGRTFDSDVKRARFSSSVAYDLAALVEMVTPWAPRHFLALATAANICKSMGVTTAVAVRAPIQRSFALEENLADIGARTSAQQVMADSLGLGLAVAVGAAQRRLLPAAHPGALPLALFAPLAAADLACVHAELKAVAFRTLNTERAQLCAAAFLDTGSAPDPTAVAAQERLVRPAALDTGALPLRIVPLAAAARDVETLLELLRSPAARRDRYVLAYELPAAPAWRPPWRRRRGPAALRGRALLALQAGAGADEALQALLQVAHLRRLPFRKDLGPQEARAWALEESYARARRDRKAFLEALHARRWQTQHLLLSSQERAPYLLA